MTPEHDPLPHAEELVRMKPHLSATSVEWERKASRTLEQMAHEVRELRSERDRLRLERHPFKVVMDKAFEEGFGDNSRTIDVERLHAWARFAKLMGLRDPPPPPPLEFGVERKVAVKIGGIVQEMTLIMQTVDFTSDYELQSIYGVSHFCQRDHVRIDLIGWRER